MLNPSKILISGVFFGSLVTTSAWAMEVPDEILWEIFIGLPHRTLVKVTPVSKQWQRVSETDELWKVHDYSSKKEFIAFPFPLLEHNHLVTLFKCKSLSRYGLFFWKLVEKVATPEEIFKDIDFMPPGTEQAGWVAKEITCTKQESNLVQYTAKLTFAVEAPPFCILRTTVPYTFTFKGSWEKEEELAF